MYDNGRGVAQDYAEAVRWYWLAADQGDAVAQNHLGFMYNNGRGVARDTALAQMWFYVAAVKGNAAKVKNTKIIAGKMTPAQIADGRRLAREWLEAHQ